jgi:serine phosphatase RsbU (regulator of sigma subunit)/anti-sigma regulatory factor (Ser/Thr protein kinase)
MSSAPPLRDGLEELLMQVPAVIWRLRGPDHVVELANPLARATVGDPERLVGLPLREAVPSVVGAGVLEMLDGVYRSGDPHTEPEVRIALGADRDGQAEERIYTYVAQPTRDPGGSVDGIVVHAFDVTPQVRARLELQQVLARSARLQRATAALSRALSEHEVGEVILDEAMGALGAAAGALALRDGDEAVVVNAEGYPEGLLTVGARFRIDDAHRPLAHVIRTGEALWLESADDWGRRFGSPTSTLGAAGAGIPLEVDGEVVAGLGFRFGQDERGFGEEERELVLTLGRLCAQALERARLYEAERRARRSAEEAEGRSAFVATVGAVLDGAIGLRERLERLAGLLVPGVADGCAIQVGEPDEEGGDLVVAHRDPARAKTMRAAGSLPHAAPDDDSAVVVPLQARGRRLGSLVLLTEANRPRLDPADVALAEDVARRASLAVDNARLFEDEQRARESADRARDLAWRLQRITASLSRALTASEVGHVVAHEVSGALAADGCAVFLLSRDGGELELVAGAGFPPDVAEEASVIPAAGPSPVAEALHRGRVVVKSGEEMRRRWPALGPVQARSRTEAAVGARLSIGQRPLGVLYVAFRRPRGVTERVLELVATLSRLCAQALDRARLYEAEREVAATLQRSLLPAALPSLPGVQLEVSYLASAQPGEVGGDWYEAIALPDGRLGLSVGDVVGRGPAAAAVMGQLRSGLRAFAMQGGGPAEVLDDLSRFAAGVPNGAVATVVYAVLDTESGELRYACAGHPPPLLIGPEGEAGYLWEGRGLPLAVATRPSYREASATIAPGSLLVLYSDGLVERSGEALDVGFGRLLEAAAASAVSRSLEEVSRRLLATVFPEAGSADDVALLMLRFLPDRPGPFAIDIPARPEELAGLRRALGAWLARTRVTAEEAMDIAMACNEAAANAIEHAYREEGSAPAVVEVAARCEPDGALEVSVRDRGRWRRIPAPGDRGRGLPLMRAVMERVDVSTGSEGTVVTMRRRLSRPPRPAEGSERA